MVTCDCFCLVQVRLLQIVSFVVSVYLPSFLLIHLKPNALENPLLTLFQQLLLLGSEEVDSVLCKAVNRYFIQLA